MRNHTTDVERERQANRYIVTGQLERVHLNGYVHECRRCDWHYGPAHFLDSPICWKAIQQRFRAAHKRYLAELISIDHLKGTLRHWELRWEIARYSGVDRWQCPGCGCDIYWKGWWGQTLLHCPKCRKTELQQRRREAVRKIRSANRPELTPIECYFCGEDFTPSRSDARYCSPACRQAAYREREATASTADG
jgi:hypothetical protein